MSDLPQTPPSPALRRWVMLAFGLGGAALVLWATRFGLGISSDSVQYVAAARSFAAGKGFHNAWRSVYVTWPPLYPIVLAFLRQLGSNYVDPTRYFQVLGYGLLVAMVVGILWEDLRHRFVALAGGLLIVASWPVLVASSRVISEPLYCLLLVATVYLYPRARARDRLRDLLWIVVPAGLAAVQRYAGAGLLAAVALYLLLESDAGTLWRRLQRALFFGATASLPLALWLVHNLVVRHSLTGVRRPSHHPFWPTLKAALWMPGSWWVPPAFGHGLAMALIIALFVVLIASLLPQAPRMPRLPRLSARIRFGGWLAMMHLAFMFGVFMYAKLTHLNTRFVTPAAPGLVLLLAGVTDELLSWARRRAAVIAATAATVSLLGMSLFTSVQHVNERLTRVEEGKAPSWAGARWTRSPILTWARERTGVHQRVYTNSFYVTTFYVPHREDFLWNLDQMAAGLEKRVPGTYLLFNHDRWGEQAKRVAALAAQHPDLVRARGPLGVVLSVDAGPPR